MSIMIEMSRESAEPGGRDRFSLSAEAWELLIDIGQAFGWQPQGTLYARKPSAKELGTAALHDYRPGNHRDRKRISAEDAKAWATALDKAQQSPHLENLLGSRTGAVVLDESATDEQKRSVNAPFEVTMKEFVEYAYGGAFSFAQAE